MRIYLVDTDVLISIYDNLPMEVYQTQWALFEKYILEGRIIICDSVYNEIKKAVELKEWLDKFKDKQITSYERETIIEAKKIINAYPKLIDINNSSDQSDPYLIALAKIKKFTILSNESYAENGKKAKIPFVCKEMGIDCLNLLSFYSEEGWKF